MNSGTSGWFKEHYRHYLAAKGIKTTNKYFATYSPQVQEQLLRFGISSDEGELKAPQVSPGTAKSRLGMYKIIPTGAEEIVRELRPVQRTIDAVKEGRSVFSEGVYAVGGEIKFKDSQGKEGVFSPAEAASLRAAANARVVELGQAGIEVPDDLKQLASPAAVRQAQAALSEFKAAGRGGLAKFGIEATKSVLPLAADVGTEAVKGVGAGLGTTAAGLGEIEAWREEASAARGEKQFGFFNKLDQLKDQPWFKNNAVIGTEEQESGFVQENLNRVPDLLTKSPYDPEAVSGALGENAVLTKRVATLKQKVDALAQSKKELAAVKKTAYEEGMRAAKKGDREAVVKSITALQGEEAKLRDRWAIVDKVHRDVVGNADVTFSKRGMFGMFGSGASEYADETQKVTETKAALKNAHNEVYARRSVLQNKLQQLNQAVPTKQLKLPSRVVRFEEDAGKPKTVAKVERAVELLTSPIQVTESVFK